MKELIEELKARASMVWHALTEKECVVLWLDKDDEPFAAHITTPDKWKRQFEINIYENYQND